MRARIVGLTCTARLKPPRKRSAAWKRFLKSPSIKEQIDKYNKNPVENWMQEEKARELSPITRAHFPLKFARLRGEKLPSGRLRLTLQ